MDEVFYEYLSSVDRVIEFATCSTFAHFGGWAAVPERYRKALVVNAVLKSPSEKPTVKELTCTSRSGKTVKIISLYHFYSEHGQIGIFYRFLQEAIEIRKTEKNSPPPVPTKPTVKKTILKPESDEEKQMRAKRAWILEPMEQEEVNKSILKAQQEGDAGAIFRIAQSYGGLIISLAAKFLPRQHPAFEDLVNDGVLTVERCVRKFEVERDEASFTTYLHRALLREFVVRAIVYKTGFQSSQVRSIGNKIWELKRKSGDRTISYMHGDPKAIAKITGEKIETVIRNQARANVICISLDAPIPGCENKKIEDTVKNESVLEASEALCLSQKKLSIVKLLEEELTLKEQIFVRQYHGIKGRFPISPYELKTCSNGAINLPRIIAAVGEFQKRLSQFCETPEFECKNTIRTLRLLLETSEKPEDTINGENALGRLLLTNIDLNRGNIFLHILLSMESGDAIIISEIFNLTVRPYSLEEIANAFCLTRQRANQIIFDEALPKIREKLKTSQNCEKSKMAVA